MNFIEEEEAAMYGGGGGGGGGRSRKLAIGVVFVLIVCGLIYWAYTRAKNQKVVVGYKDDGTPILKTRGEVSPEDTWWWPWSPTTGSAGGGGSGTSSTPGSGGFWDNVFTKPSTFTMPPPDPGDGHTYPLPGPRDVPPVYTPDPTDPYAFPYVTRDPGGPRTPPPGHTQSPWQQQETTHPTKSPQDLDRREYDPDGNIIWNGY